MARNKNVDRFSRETLLRSIAGGRSSLLLILIFTVVNLLFIVLDVDRYFLFAASVPYYLTSLGKGMDNGFVNGAWDTNGTYTVTALIISVVILAFYLLCWLLSKKKTGWLTAALVLFILDTVALVLFTFALYDNPMVNLVDFLLHAWAIWELGKGAKAGGRLKKLPAEDEMDLRDFAAIPTLDSDSQDVL